MYRGYYHVNIYFGGSGHLKQSEFEGHVIIISIEYEILQTIKQSIIFISFIKIYSISKIEKENTWDEKKDWRTSGIQVLMAFRRKPSFSKEYLAVRVCLAFSQIVDKLIGHTCETIILTSTKSCWIGLLTFRTYERTCIVSEGFDLRILDMGLSRNEGFTLILLILDHLVQLLHLYLLLSKSVPTSTDNFRHSIRLTFTVSIFFRLNLLGTHSFCSFGESFPFTKTDGTVPDRLQRVFSMVVQKWFLNQFHVRNRRQRLHFFQMNLVGWEWLFSFLSSLFFVWKKFSFSELLDFGLSFPELLFF